MASSVDSIRTFLARVRRHLYRAEGARTGLLALSALCATALVTPLVALALVGARATAVAIAGGAGLIAVLVVVAGVVIGVIVPRRRWSRDAQVARWVGTRIGSVASDLLSSVELTGGPARRGAPSPELVSALVDATARQIARIDDARLVPRSPVKRAAALCTGALACHALVFVAAPGALVDGWGVLLHAPRRPFGGADLSSVPLVGDVDITLEYPAYSKRPNATLSSSSGDFRAMPGTQVTIETSPLEPVAGASILIERAGATETIAMKVVGDRLRAGFLVEADLKYRFQIERRGGGRRVEAAPHTIELEADRAPEVELVAPADELDVTNQKRIELAYRIEDDYGIAKAELVWETRGTEPRRRPLPLPAEPSSRAQGKLVWDMAEVMLPPGAQVAYHLEVTDNDAIRGPNIGKSKTFHLRVFSPRERHEQTLARQQETAEKMLRTLGVRLTLPPEEPAAREAVHRLTSELVVELGALVAAYDGDSHADKNLPKALEAMRDRLDKLVAGEGRLLDPTGGSAPRPTSAMDLRARDARGDNGAPIPRALGSASSDRKAAPSDGGRAADRTARRGKDRRPLPAGRFAAGDRAMLAELEEDVLTLADWLDREHLEALLDVQDEIAGHQKRLKELLDQFAKTGDPRLKAEIAREMRALEQRLAEIAQKRAGMAEDVLDQFVNTDALQEQQASGCYDDVRRLFEAGHVAEAQARLADCGNRLDAAASAMEGALEALRGDRFGEEQKKLDELMNDLADLASDQRDVAGEADRMFERYADRADELMRDLSREARRKLSATLQRLEERIDAIPESGLTPFAKEELDIVRRRLGDLDRMLSDGDLAEALGMARQAQASLDTVTAELEAALEDDPHSPWAADTQTALEAAERAHPPMKKLVDELATLTPTPDEIMTADDKRQLERLRRRQHDNQERARRLGERAQQMAPELPGDAGGEIAGRVGEAHGKMEAAEKRMRERDPSAARDEARAAADALEQARQRARDAARQRQADGSNGFGSEPIRIPGAEEYRAPEAFREDILEAMKKRAPEGYDDLVRRYYEELIR